METLKKTTETLSGIIVFMIDKRHYCLDFDEVYVILKFSEYQELSGYPLPCKSDFKLNNKIVHLIQIEDQRFYKKITNMSRMIIVEVKEHFIAFWADSISEVRLFEKEELKKFKEQNKKLTKKRGMSIVTGSFNIGEKTFLVPDFASVECESWN